MPGVDVDITVNNATSIAKSRILQAYSEGCPAVRPLVLLVAEAS